MLSIIVCTRNRPVLLARYLESFAIQKGDVQVLVVDQSDTSASVPNDPRFRHIADGPAVIPYGAGAAHNRRQFVECTSSTYVRIEVLQSCDKGDAVLAYVCAIADGDYILSC